MAALGLGVPAHAQPEAGQKARSDAEGAIRNPSAPVKDMSEGAVPTKPAVSPPSHVDAPHVAPPVQGELYGPPVPKVAKGKLPAISWTAAPEGVPPALDEAVNIVTRNYPSAKSARAALGAAAADVRSANWQRFPRLTSELDTYSGIASEPSVAVELPIWSGGRIGAEIKRSKAAENASSANYVDTVQDLALTTSQAYFEVARLAQREQLLAESVAEHRRLVGTMERRVKQEVSPLADLELARSRAAQIEQEYTIARAQRRSTLRVLAELIADPNYDLGSIPPYQAADLENRDVLEDQSVAYDPELRRLNATVDVARAEADARKASIFPQVDARYSYDYFRKSQVGFVLRAQTAGGLSQLSDVESARLRIQGALENVRVAEQQLRRNVANDIIEFDAAKARAEISTGASSTASAVSESYMRQFIAGRRSWLDVMNALREAVTAQLGKVDAEASVMSTRVRLLLRSGRWHPVFQQNSPSEQPRR